MKYIITLIVLMWLTPYEVFSQSYEGPLLRGDHPENSLQNIISNNNLLIPFIGPSANNISFRNEDIYYLDSLQSGSDQVSIYNYDELDRFTDRQSKREGILTSKLNMTYIGNTLLINGYVSEGYSASDASLKWRNEVKYTYNSQALIKEISLTNYKFDTNTQTRELDKYEYDLQGNLVSAAIVEIDSNEQEILKSRNEYYYNQDNKLDRIYLYRDSAQTNNIIHRSTKVYSYDSENKLSSVSLNVINNNNAGDITNYTYDDFGNVKSTTYMTNDNSLNSRLNEFTYNNDISIDMLSSPFFQRPPDQLFDLQFSQILSRKITTFETNGEIANTFEQNYFWSLKDINTKVTTLDNSQVKVYPMPASEKLNIEGLDNDSNYFLQIYDPLGRSVKSVTLSNNNSTIDITSIPNGSYFYTILKNKMEFHSGNFIKL